MNAYLSLTLYPIQLRSLKDDSNRLSRAMFNVEIVGSTEFIHLVIIKMLIGYMYINKLGYRNINLFTLLKIICSNERKALA